MHGEWYILSLDNLRDMALQFNIATLAREGIL